MPFAPWLAPVAPLLPTTLMADFTRQLLPRDYLFQTFMSGEQWSKVAGKLTPDEESNLWRQLARLATAIGSVRGEAFGHPPPGQRFATWSETVLTWLEWAIRDAEAVALDTTELRRLRDAAEAHASWLDEIREPRLLHGDLWPMNALIERGAGEPRIVALLDNDRVSWGDPLAEWTFHLLKRRGPTGAHTAFWDEYGRPDETHSARFRAAIYEGLHAGNVLSAVRRERRDDLVPGVQASLREIVASLDDLA